MNKSILGAQGGAQQKRPPRAPFVTPDTEFIWDGVNERELRVQRCSNCGTLRNPPRPMCSVCSSLDWAPYRVTGVGTIYSYVVYHHPQMDGFECPYVVAVVELEEGVRFVANVVGTDPADVEIGQGVGVTFEDVGDGVVLPQFRLN